MRALSGPELDIAVHRSHEMGVKSPFFESTKKTKTKKTEAVEV